MPTTTTPPDLLVWNDQSKRVASIVLDGCAAKKPLVVVLDLDGTALDYPDNRLEAQWVPEVLAAAQTLASQRGTHLVLLTARPAEEALGLVQNRGLDTAILFGQQGLQRFDVASGKPVGLPSAQLQQAQKALAAATPVILHAVDESERRFQTQNWQGQTNILAMEGQDSRRGLQDLDRLYTRLKRELQKDVGSGVHLRAPRWGRIEVAARHDVTKGQTVKQLLNMWPDASMVVAGDDTKDLSAFDAVREARSERNDLYAVAVWNEKADNNAGTPADLAATATHTASDSTELGNALAALALSRSAALSHPYAAPRLAPLEL